MTGKRKRVSRREIEILIKTANKTGKVKIEMTSWKQPYSMLINPIDKDAEHHTRHYLKELKIEILKLPIWDEIAVTA